MTELEQAAHAYIAARYALRGADQASTMAAIYAVDWAWHQLTVAAGAHDPQCEDCAHRPLGTGWGGSVDTVDPTLFDDLERYG